ncbi:HD domain-containing phosphohydrolase [Ornatilinea apprima]|uniref:HD domain-containing phosphohydrolase n=1 Tax=Ornatilinea apprima TaxID=1134406 RepID=UPI00128FC5E0|nr:HD domain-containing phosphohydrolase [Ornatilinea apprima]
MIPGTNRKPDLYSALPTMTQQGTLASLPILHLPVEAPATRQDNDLRRMRRLVELKMLCNLSKELSTSDPQDALLDRLARHAVELSDAAFGKILAREAEGSFTCQAVFRAADGNNHSQEVPPASWPHYHQVLMGKSPQLIQRGDPRLNPSDITALGLDQASGLWVLPLWAGSEPVGLFVLGEQAQPQKNAYTSIDRIGLMTNIADQATIGLQRKKLNQNLETSFIEIILALAETIEVGDATPMRHSNQTSQVAYAIANRMNMSEEMVKAVRWAGLLHDIGKIQVPEEILRKPGPLTNTEWEIMKQHPIIGAELLAPVSRFKEAIPMIESHHEKVDGSGYPYGLKGDQIPLGGRILAVADAFSAMLCGRVYCHPYSLGQTLLELQRCKNTHFDPSVVDALISLIQEGYQF